MHVWKIQNVWDEYKNNSKQKAGEWEGEEIYIVSSLLIFFPPHKLTRKSLAAMGCVQCLYLKQPMGFQATDSQGSRLAVVTHASSMFFSWQLFQETEYCSLIRIIRFPEKISWMVYKPLKSNLSLRITEIYRGPQLRFVFVVLVICINHKLPKCQKEFTAYKKDLCCLQSFAHATLHRENSGQPTFFSVQLSKHC